MNWNTEPPVARVWALVLWKNGAHPIPWVGQYEPQFGTWTAGEGDFHKSRPWQECEWAPLPEHESFSDKTHDVDHTSPALEKQWKAACDIAQAHLRPYCELGDSLFNGIPVVVRRLEKLMEMNETIHSHNVNLKARLDEAEERAEKYRQLSLAIQEDFVKLKAELSVLKMDGRDA